MHIYGSVRNQEDSKLFLTTYLRERVLQRSFDSNSIFSTSYQLPLNGRKAFHRSFFPSLISFNDNTIHGKKFHFEAFQRFTTNLKGICK